MNLATADEVQAALAVLATRASDEMLDRLPTILAVPAGLRHDLVFAHYQATLSRYAPMATQLAYTALSDDNLTLPDSYLPPVRKTHSNIGYALSKPDTQFHLSRALMGDMMDVYRAPVISAVDTTSASLRLREAANLPAKARAAALRRPVLDIPRSASSGWKALASAQRSGAPVAVFDSLVTQVGSSRDARRILRDLDSHIAEAEKLLRDAGLQSAWVPAEALTGSEDGVKVNSKVVWARHARGDSCGFCRLMATRGAVYRTETTAGGGGNNYHRSCRCIPVPSTHDKPYKPAPYVNEWSERYERLSQHKSEEKVSSPGELFTKMGK